MMNSRTSDPSNDASTAEPSDWARRQPVDGAEMKDLEVPQGVEAGAPVFVTPAQKARIDRLVGKLGSDELARRARESYGKAVTGGQIRVR